MILCIRYPHFSERSVNLNDLCRTSELRQGYWDSKDLRVMSVSTKKTGLMGCKTGRVAVSCFNYKINLVRTSRMGTDLEVRLKCQGLKCVIGFIRL